MHNRFYWAAFFEKNRDLAKLVKLLNHPPKLGASIHQMSFPLRFKLSVILNVGWVRAKSFARKIFGAKRVFVAHHLYL